MKYPCLFVLFIFFCLWLIGCGEKKVQNRTATVVISTKCSLKDTIRIKYYKNLKISFGSLVDENDDILAYDIKYFSIIKDN